jgi:hypothetical protein
VEQSNGRSVQLQLDPAILVRPKFVADGDRPIYSCIDPIIRAGRLKRNCPLGKRETRYYRWRIIFICKCQLRKEQRERHCHS